MRALDKNLFSNLVARVPSGLSSSTCVSSKADVQIWTIAKSFRMFFKDSKSKSNLGKGSQRGAFYD